MYEVLKGKLLRVETGVRQVQSPGVNVMWRGIHDLGDRDLRGDDQRSVHCTDQISSETQVPLHERK
jgi:hypothetical protein